MKLKFLLFLMIIGLVNHAQVVCDYPEGVNRSLVISEASLISALEAYVELTNMGNEPILLSDYKFGRLIYAHASTARISDLCNDPWYTTTHMYLFLPNRILNPGESFVLTGAYDYGPVHYKEGLGREGGSERPKRIGIYEVADKLIHFAEPISGVYYAEDSVTTAINDPEQLIPRGDYSLLFNWILGGTYYIEHHYSPIDSAVVDQVGGVFDYNRANRLMAYDVAGVTGGVNTTILVRKATYEVGNIDFANGRGLGLDDSEWMPIQLPEGYNAWRDIFWTIGNHGNFQLDENTLEPNTEAIAVDFAAKKITVPWGIRRLDDIMRQMKQKPGVAWWYDLNPLKEDSLYRSARDGDQLTIYVVGNTLQSATFEIVVNESTADDNIVVPIDRPTIWGPGVTGPVTTRSQNGILSWPRVTRHASGVDTITGSAFGLPFDLRTDTLMKYLEKPEKATWEFVWVDGVKRPDLKNGDMLKVTSENGAVKEYFIQVQTHWPSTNADLSSITWPDIPDFYRGIFGWNGDTIPNFSAGTTIYRVEVPIDVDDIPALVAKTSHVNAKVQVTRAKTLSGSMADRIVTFEVTAENDTVHKTYQVELVKEKSPDKIEPFHADPFISEYAYRYVLANNFIEIYNPGNQPIDLRNYMIAYLHRNNSNDFFPIGQHNAWARRFTKYIPGLKYVDKDLWDMYQYYAIPDPNINPILHGGETFVLAKIQRGNDYESGIEDFFPEYDVQFMNNWVPGFGNPWNEDVHKDYMPLLMNNKNGLVLYKILNDSIKRGLKPITDPNDFKVIDIWTTADGSSPWTVADYELDYRSSFIRKPHVTKGNPVRGASFGTTAENSEWFMVRANIDYAHLPAPDRHGMALSSLNQHYMIAPTYYKSTVNSSVYKVSDGFGPDEEIFGLKAGTTVAEFLSNIYKEDEGQSLTITAAGDGSELGMDAVPGMNDLMTVISADSVNTTVYRLDVTEAGLSNNAYLTSNRWTIDVSKEPKSAGDASAEDDGIGSVSNFNYGTTIKTIVDNITVPDGATLTVIDGNGAYVPFTTLNFDTTYVNVTVNPDIYLDVVAEDNVTRIVYQLQPSTSGSDAFILSDLYEVSQMDNLIHFVPRGTNFQAFLANIIPSLGASLKLVDKMGHERVYGNIREDDKVVVTSANGEYTRVYFISFLPTSAILQTTYLAYVLSEAYIVNQVDYVISAGLATLTSETLLEEFMGYLMPSMGATVSVIDKNGEVKTSGDLNDGDKLVVSSADGKISTTYTLALDLTSAGPVERLQRIEIWPNPASDRLQIQGVEAGNRIRIYSAAGALIRDVKAQSNRESISLESVPFGMFLIVISDNGKPLGNYKAIRR
jgi:hypothetical protein